MRVQAVVLTFAAAVTVLCSGTALPVEETDVELTASDADAGNWTANLGDVQIQIEHEHGSVQNANSTWTLGISHTAYERFDSPEEETQQQEKSDESSQITPNTDEPTYLLEPIDYSYKPSMEQEKVKQDTNADEDVLTNNIPDDVLPNKMYEDSSSDPGFHLPSLAHLFSMLPPPPPPLQYMYPPPPPQEQWLNRGYAPMTSAPFINYDDDNDDGNSDEVVTDPDNFEFFDGVGWFKLDSREMSWEEARAACEDVGAHLAVPDSQQRVQVFIKLFQRHPEIPMSAILRAQAYVGVNDPQNKRDFTTVQGKPFNPGFPIWFLNEPNNAPPGESCVTFHMEGRTRDVPCFYSLPFFCEKDTPFLVPYSQNKQTPISFRN